MLTAARFAMLSRRSPGLWRRAASLRPRVRADAQARREIKATRPGDGLLCPASNERSRLGRRSRDARPQEASFAQRAPVRRGAAICPYATRLRVSGRGSSIPVALREQSTEGFPRGGHSAEEEAERLFATRRGPAGIARMRPGEDHGQVEEVGVPTHERVRRDALQAQGGRTTASSSCRRAPGSAAVVDLPFFFAGFASSRRGNLIATPCATGAEDRAGARGVGDPASRSMSRRDGTESKSLLSPRSDRLKRANGGPNPGGCGLGLAIVRAIAESHAVSPHAATARSEARRVHSPADVRALLICQRGPDRLLGALRPRCWASGCGIVGRGKPGQSLAFGRLGEGAQRASVPLSGSGAGA